MADDQSELSHYVSEYYDPIKAHDYYERTKRLKGNSRNVSDLKGKGRKQGWVYAKKNVGEAKKNESKATAQKQKAEMERLRQSAQAKRLELRTRLTAVISEFKVKQKAQNEALSTKFKEINKEAAARRTAKLEKIAADANEQLANLPPLSRSASVSAQTARAKKVAEIQDTAKAEAGKVIVDSNVELETIKADQRAAIAANSQEINNLRSISKAEAEKIGSELKSSISQAQTKYKGLKEALKGKYEAIYQREFDAIKTSSSKG